MGLISEDFTFTMFHCCRKTVVVGAGYISVELAGVLANLGSETHLLIRYDNVLRTFDHTISEALTEAIDKGPITLHKKTQVSIFFAVVTVLNRGLTTRKTHPCNCVYK
jgi:glutathione reductase (NADPH)